MSLHRSSRTLLQIYAALGTSSAYASGRRRGPEHGSAAAETPTISDPGACSQPSWKSPDSSSSSASTTQPSRPSRTPNREPRRRGRRWPTRRARVELREKLHVAAKERENAELKSLAELQEARQRGWIIAFAISACGVACAAGALSMAGSARQAVGHGHGRPQAAQRHAHRSHAMTCASPCMRWAC